jgi:hypothetical protein
MLHLNGCVLNECGDSGRDTFVAQVHRDRSGEWVAGGGIELGAVHAAGDVRTVERAQFQRRIHVSAAPLDGIKSAPAIADDNLLAVKFNGFHPARCNLIGTDGTDEIISQGPRPLATIEAGYPSPLHLGVQTGRTNSV